MESPTGPRGNCDQDICAWRITPLTKLVKKYNIDEQVCSIQKKWVEGESTLLLEVKQTLPPGSKATIHENCIITHDDIMRANLIIATKQSQLELTEVERILMLGEKQKEAEQKQPEQKQFEQKQFEQKQFEQKQFEQKRFEWQFEQKQFEQKQFEQRQAEQRQAEQRQAEQNIKK